MDTQRHIRSLAVAKMRRPGACMEVAKTRGDRKTNKQKTELELIVDMSDNIFFVFIE